MRIVVGIATTGDRPNELKHTLESLNEQTVKADLIHVHDNSKEIDYTDNAKFIILSHLPDEVYFFSCDDDILYPEDYIEKTIEAIETHQCIVSYHGRILRGLNRSYYHGHTALACKHHFPRTVELDIVGTGVCAWKTSYFNPTELYKAEDKCMSDLVFSLEATKQGKKMMHIGHKAKWIVPQELPKGTTIYEAHHRNDKRQSEIADEIWRIKNK